MRKILILLSLSLVFLNASPYNLERLKQEENSIAKDYYIYRLLEKKTISKKEAEGLNSHIFRYVGKIKSELEKLLKDKREDYEKFFKAFGLSLKYGIYESYGMEAEFLKDLLLYHSAKQDKLITLRE